MKVNIQDIGGYVAKKDDRYVVTDNPFGNTLVLSSTRLHGKKETSGNSHYGQVEFYFFFEGKGQLELDN